MLNYWALKKKFGLLSNMPAANSGLALWGLTCLVETFMQDSTFVLRMNSSAKNPPQRQAAKRYSQW